MTKYINSGAAKLRIEESATRKQGRIDSGQETVVGVNKYRLDDETAKEEMIDIRQIDNAKSRETQLMRLKEVKASRDEAKVQEALEKLTASANLTTSTSNGDDPNNLLKLAIDAAALRYVFYPVP
jgi:methylmalonyl-CoA mutase